MNPSYISGGAIGRARFVQADTTNGPLYIVQGDATHRSCGISQEGSWIVPGLFNYYGQTDTMNAATASGQQIGVHGEKEMCAVEAGAAFAYGAVLQSDANGRAITLASGGFAGAVALDSATASGQWVQVQVRISAGPAA